MPTPTSKRQAVSAEGKHTHLKLGFILHFFTNLSLAADVEEPLFQAGLGRPHHRILYFAAHMPGITVSELLSVMHVTHQNLRLPMKTLMDKGFLLMKAAEQDRRQRQLFVTSAGKKLVDRLAVIQWKRVARAFEAAGPQAVDGFLKVQEAMIDPADLAWVARLQRS
jgi:DNA-binding MarR family transcriptional regulator